MKKNKKYPNPNVIAYSLITSVRSNKNAIVCSAVTLRSIANRSRLEETLLSKIRKEAAERGYLFAKTPNGGFLVCAEKMFKNAVEI